MRFAPTLALLLVAAAPAPPVAPTPEVKRQVGELLGAIHGPVDPQAFRNLGPGAEEALAEFARGSELPSRRIRALEGLAGLGGPRAERVHRELAADTGAPSVVRRAAVRGLGKLLGASAAPAALTGFLEGDPDPAVRATAAEALATHAPAECAKVRARAMAEADPSRFTRALATCDRPDLGKPAAR